MISSDFKYISELCRIERSNLKTYDLIDRDNNDERDEIIAWIKLTNLQGALLTFTTTGNGFTSTSYLKSGTAFRVIGFKDKTRIINAKPRKK